MQRCLYLLCPTDCLESVINRTFRNENYFYTSLGNSVVLSNGTITEIKKTIHKHHIDEVYFVLSNTNHFVIDALENCDFSTIRGLHTFYKEIKTKKNHSDFFWDRDYNHFLILSYYLNSKIKELEQELNGTINPQLKIRGKIYDRFLHKFKNVYSELICIEKQYLN